MADTDAPKPSGRPVKPDDDVLPTVFVGLGGTGMEVLLRLRRRILQADWNGVRINSLSEFPVAEFLYFDTDMNEAREKGNASSEDPMWQAIAIDQQGSEAIQRQANVAFYQQNRGNHPAIDEWLPTRDLSNIDTTKGAGQVRAISRLLFFQEFDRFRSAIANKARAVTANVSHEAISSRLGLKIQQSLRVVVIGSVAGGTGSGAFIDAGLSIRSMDPKPSRVDMFLMLPGAYTAHNKDRVFANAFAALSELEHVMLPDPQPPYVRYWTSVEQPTVQKPYSDVYLFDTRNLNGDATNAASDIFDMMADILFEDFGNSDFASNKRSISVNKEQNKSEFFSPPLSPEFGENARRYSQGYSACGQSTIATMGSIEHEAKIVDAGRTMLEAFFGVAANRIARTPTPEKRDEFMAHNLFLQRVSYDDFPETLRSTPPAIPCYTLIELLLQRADKSSADIRLMQDIDEGFQRIRETVNDPADWLREAIALMKLRERDIGGTAGEGIGLRGEEIIEARQRLLKELKAETGDRSLKSKFYALLDDQENAGLDYTIELINEINATIGAEGQGATALLERAEMQFAKAADQIQAEEYSESLLRLETAGKPRLFGVDRKAATQYLSQVQGDMKALLRFRMRALAAKEARIVLEQIVGYMGEKLAAGEDGIPRWSGLLNEFMAGHAAVIKTMELVDADVKRVRDTVRRPQSGSFMVVGGVGRGELDEVDRSAALDWARQAFKDYGGSRILFAMLKTEGERLVVLNQLRAIAKSKMATMEQNVPTVVDALRTMQLDERRRTLERMLTRATPWLHGQFDRFKPIGKHYTMLISVHDAKQFEQEFGPLIKQLIPTKLGIDGISYASSGEKGRIICYCELTGFPLDVISPLREDWRKSYLLETSATNPFPIHNHHDALRFPSPVVPTNAELVAIREDLSLFIKGVVFGILQRRPGPGEQYRFELVPGDFRQIGTEQKIRRLRLDPAIRKPLQLAIDKFEAKLQPVQLLAISVLLDWTARRAYAPRRILTTTGTRVFPGITNKTATDLAQKFTSRFNSLSERPRLGMPEEDAKNKLHANIAEWTRVIPDSLDDVESMEANRSLDDGAEYLAVDKRVIDQKAFSEEALQRILKPAQEGPLAFAPPPPTGSIYVVLDGQTAGPFDPSGLRALIATGKLSLTAQVFDQSTNGPWVLAADLPPVAALFRVPPPPPPPPVS